MLKSALFACLSAVWLASGTAADVVCPDSSYVEVVFNRTYPDDSQFAGQPYDYLTIAPNGSGETFSNVNGIDEGDGLLDIEVRVYLRNCQGEPCAGISGQRIVLSSEALCICTDGARADTDTDTNGMVAFTGTLNGGGCTSNVEVLADGVFIGTLSDETGRTVKVNSTDAAHALVTPCFTSSDDLAAFASVFRRPASDPGYVCWDYNERGVNINASDLAAFAFVLGAACR